VPYNGALLKITSNKKKTLQIKDAVHCDPHEEDNF